MIAQTSDVISMERGVVRDLTKSFLEVRIKDWSKETKRGSFILSDILGYPWMSQAMPFYQLYQSEKVAGQEMGKLLGQVCRKLGLVAKRENRFGKKDAITRYFL